MHNNTYAPLIESARSTLLPWVVAAILLFAAYLLLHENGSLISPAAAQFLHEATHDARHALGVPCH